LGGRDDLGRDDEIGVETDLCGIEGQDTVEVVVELLDLRVRGRLGLCCC
jgi:hypothetical protein